MVVGAAASGAQIADEIQRSGRPVTLAVGEHVRACRTYRGRDLQWWMDVTGLNDERYDQVENLRRARSLSSFQLAGYADRRDIDLNALTSLGVKLMGRLAGDSGRQGPVLRIVAQSVRAGRPQAEPAAEHDRRVGGGKRRAATRSIRRIAPSRRASKHRRRSGSISVAAGIRTIVWATGFRPDYSWLDVPVLDHKGNIRHDGGVVTEAPGLYVMGLPFLRRRKSSLIDGAGDDARDLSAHLASYLGARSATGGLMLEGSESPRAAEAEADSCNLNEKDSNRGATRAHRGLAEGASAARG